MAIYSLYAGTTPISALDITTYTNSPGVLYTPADALKLINTQYWIASFLNGPEAFANFRRSGFPNLTPNPYGQPNNPDVLNLMGFSKRKMGDQTGAMEYYDKALSLQPNHIGANEYLGELYLEMKLPAKAEERLSVLQQVCGNCEEYGELKEKIDQYKATNG